MSLSLSRHGLLLSRWLQAARDRAGLSRAELARALGKTYQMIHSIESGQRFPSPELVLDIARVTGLEDDSLLLGLLLLAEARKERAEEQLISSC